MADGKSAPDGSASPRTRQNREIARIVAAGAIVVVLVAFVLDNSRSVKVGFVFSSATVPLIWVLIVTALLGAGLDRLVIWRSRQHRGKGAGG